MALEAGRPASAARLLGAADAELQRTGMKFDQFERFGYEQAKAGARAALSAPEFVEAHESGRYLGRDNWFAEADAIVSLLEAAELAPSQQETRTPCGLTRRECDILILVAEGLSDREVAATLFIGQGTVRSHLSSIFGKLEVSSRTAAVAAARRQDIL
jgi:DNA-binding NarL/FixJ family response regulator